MASPTFGSEPEKKIDATEVLKATCDCVTSAWLRVLVHPSWLRLRPADTLEQAEWKGSIALIIVLFVLVYATRFWIRFLQLHRLETLQQFLATPRPVDGLAVAIVACILWVWPCHARWASRWGSNTYITRRSPFCVRNMLLASNVTPRTKLRRDCRSFLTTASTRDTLAIPGHSKAGRWARGCSHRVHLMGLALSRSVDFKS